jgi:signal transduction histidine kinase
VGSATHEPSDGHFLFVERATLDLVQQPTFVGLATNFAIGQPNAFGEQCGNSEIQVAEDGRSFTFDDPRAEPGCGEALLRVPVPAGAQRLFVSFQANRLIGDTSDGLPHSLVQEFRIFGPDGELELSRDYFDNTAGAQETLENFTFEQPVPSGFAEIVLSWLFDDQGVESPIPGQSVGGLQSFEATVAGLQLSWDDVRLAAPRVVEGPEVEAPNGTLSTRRFHVHVEVPSFVVSPGTNATPSVVVRHGPRLVGLQGPAGPVPADGSVESDDGVRLTSLVTPEVVALQGPGTYNFTFQTVRMLPPAPAPEPPVRIYPFFFILALLPLVAAILALHQANLYVRQAEGSYRRTAWPVFVAVLLVVAYYLLLLGYSWLGVGPERMSTWPLAREPLLIYVQFVLLLLMLAGSALAVSRTLIGSMRRDLDERRRKEDQLRRSNEELERFAYVASHDLQEPLRKVAGFTALLQKRYSGRLDRDADEIIQYAVDGATRMQMLIKDILAYSRVGSKELQRVPVDANATMQLVASDLGEQIKDQRAEVSWDALPTVRADASQLRQVLQNLVENAIKYRHPKRRPKVQVSAVNEGSDWHFLVADNGQGIPQDKHEEIFGIFRRLHGQDTPGTGIGLAVAKKAVERHGGKIWVDSAPGKGATFHFTLPRSVLDKGAWTSQAQVSGAATQPS